MQMDEMDAIICQLFCKFVPKKKRNLLNIA